MKVTSRGKEFLWATIAGSVVATALDVRIVLALCLSLIFTALIAETILKSSQEDLKIEPELSHVSCFKGQNSFCNLLVRKGKHRFVNVSILKLVPPHGVETESQINDGQSFQLRFQPRYAGRFYGLSAQFVLVDALQLFTKKIEFAANDFYVDCYPSSILKDIKTARPLSVSLGELQGLTHGAGSEFYAVDEYAGITEKKDIFWKRVASMPDERLLVKMRVANIQKSISIALVNASERSQEYFEWIDAVCEGVGSLGKAALQIGRDVELKFHDGGKIIVVHVSDLRELLEGIMEMSASVCFSSLVN
ncbi:MAG: hypothetical protein JRN20_08080 [Nitrososphaerota archaeon]|nr:hypothetical protein [Nitrososphaerota archaeon]